MELKLCKSFKKLWLPNPKTVVAMQVEEQSIDSTRKIELLVKKDSRPLSGTLLIYAHTA